MESSNLAQFRFSFCTTFTETIAVASTIAAALGLSLFRFPLLLCLVHLVRLSTFTALTSSLESLGRVYLGN